MKRILFLALFLGAMSACQHTDKPINEILQETAKLNISIPHVQTKLTDIGDDSKVNSVQVFVFKSTGDLDAYGASTASSLNLTCTTGPKEIFALVNAPDLSSINTLSALQNASSNLSDNRYEGLVMTKDTTVNVLSDMNLNLNVKRLAARVCLKSIRNSMESIQHRTKSFNINAIYLINVVGDRKYFSSSEPLVWYNKISTSSDLTRLLYDGMGNHQINYGQAYTGKHYFYCYPNAQAEDTSASTWSPRYTRLVVEANFGGQLCYYPISIPNIQQNKVYNISLVVSIPGSTSPDAPIEKVNQGVTIEVEDWEISEDIVETI